MPSFWFVMSMGLLVGFIIAYPMNWWLVANHLKHGMMTVRPSSAGTHDHSGHAPMDGIPHAGHPVTMGAAAAPRPPAPAMIMLSFLALALGLAIAFYFGRCDCNGAAGALSSNFEVVVHSAVSVPLCYRPIPVI